MNKKNPSRIVKELLSSRGRDVSKMEITPYRDWRILVGVFFVALMVSFGFNIYMSISVNRDDFFVVSQRGSEAVVLNEDGISKIIADFSSKEMIFEKTINEGVSIVDPSL